MYEFLEHKKILLVEDNPDSRYYAQCNLIKLNVNLFLASDGNEAIEILKKENIDLILMDLYMPEMNGIQCIKKIRYEMYISIPIIVITAGIIDFHTEIEPLINGIITKPYKRMELLELINKFI
jgi:CheY-like chemotaxis protein